jgi:predicted XRE-type DNA-binding protein
MIENGEVFESVWDALEDTPEAAEVMKRRSKLMDALEEHIQRQGWFGSQAARRLDTSEDRIASLLNGDIDSFTEAELLAMCRVAGLPGD